jgi:tetratricopeptide (TPR) repeat protein
MGEAFLKTKEFDSAQQVIDIAEEFGRKYHGNNEDNMFFGKFYVLKGMCVGADSKRFQEAKSMFEKGIKILELSFSGPDKHKLQAFAHLQLGRLYSENKKYDEAKEQYLMSESIFEKVLKNKRFGDVSELYKQLVILGVHSHDESLIHTYLDKLNTVFGLDHDSTKNTILYLDQRKAQLPF